MGSGRDKRKKVKEKAKVKEAAAERADKQRQREKVLAAGGDGAAAEAEALLEVVTPEEKKKKKKLSGMKELTEMINDIRKSDKQRTIVTIETCLSPTPRLNSSLTLINNNEAIMFGGEFYDGQPTSTYVCNDLFRWNIDRNSWSQIYSINTPPPRCSHQSVVFRDQYFMFGGEFCTSDKFHHHRDLWRLNLNNNTWDEIKSRGGPSARSGHRMAIWRNCIILFGGFYEAFKETQWFNDLYVFSITTLQWKKIVFAPTQPLPSPRSGHQLVVYNDMLIVTGGYAKVKRSKKTEAKVHRDMWTLNLTPMFEHTTKKEDYPEEWVRVPRRGHAPSDRAGAVMVLFRKAAVQFGGVFDGANINTQPVGFDNTRVKKVATQAVFFNDMFSFDLEANRWHEMPLLARKDPNARRRKLKEDGTEYEEEESEEGEEEEDLPKRAWDGNGALYGSCRQSGTTSLLANIETEATLECSAPSWMEDGDLGWPIHSQLTQWGLKYEEEVKVMLELKRKREEEEALMTGPSSLEKNQKDKTRMPLGRLNPAVLLRGHHLIIYGGSFEHKKREWALDDCWSIDLLKRDAWTCLIEGTPMDLEKEASDDEEEEESDEDEDDDDDDDSSDEDEEREVKLSEIDQLRHDIDVRDPLTPKAEETLRDYFTRTAGQWATIALEESSRSSDGAGKQTQEQLKDSALKLATEQYGDMLPSILRLLELEKHEKAGSVIHVDKKAGKKAKSKSSSKKQSGARDPVGMVVRV